MGTVSASLIIFTVRDGPPTPPSGNSNSNDKKFSLVKEFKVLIKNKNYIFLCIAYLFIHSNTAALSSMISSLTREYGYSGGDNGLFGAVYIISGIIGSVISGMLLDRFQKFRFTLLTTLSVAIIANILLFITLPTGNVLLFSLNMGLNGLGIVPVSPISYGFAVELTFPTPEHVSNGLMVLLSKIYSGAIGLLSGYLSEYHDPKYAILVFIINGIISLIGCLFIKEELKRL